MTAFALTTTSASGALHLRCDEIQFAEAIVMDLDFFLPEVATTVKII